MKITPRHFPTLYEAVDSTPCLWLTNVGEKDGTWWEVLPWIDSRRLVFSCRGWRTVKVIWNALTDDMKGKLTLFHVSVFVVFVILLLCFWNNFHIHPLITCHIEATFVSLQKSNGLLVDLGGKSEIKAEWCLVCENVKPIRNAFVKLFGLAVGYNSKQCSIWHYV